MCCTLIPLKGVDRDNKISNISNKYQIYDNLSNF